MDGQTSFISRRPFGVYSKCVEGVTAECPTAVALVGWESRPCGPSRAGALLHRKAGRCPRSSWLLSRAWHTAENLQLWLPACGSERGSDLLWLTLSDNSVPPEVLGPGPGTGGPPGVLPVLGVWSSGCKKALGWNMALLSHLYLPVSSALPSPSPATALSTVFPHQRHRVNRANSSEAEEESS